MPNTVLPLIPRMRHPQRQRNQTHPSNAAHRPVKAEGSALQSTHFPTLWLFQTRFLAQSIVHRNCSGTDQPGGVLGFCAAMSQEEHSLETWFIPVFGVMNKVPLTNLRSNVEKTKRQTTKRVQNSQIATLMQKTSRFFMQGQAATRATPRVAARIRSISRRLNPARHR